MDSHTAKNILAAVLYQAFLDLKSKRKKIRMDAYMFLLSRDAGTYANLIGIDTDCIKEGLNKYTVKNAARKGDKQMIMEGL